MIHILLVNIDGYWKQIYKSFANDSYDKCMKEAEKLDQNFSWMIVLLKRQHSGVEIDTIHTSPTQQP